MHESSNRPRKMAGDSFYLTLSALRSAIRNGGRCFYYTVRPWADIERSRLPYSNRLLFIGFGYSDVYGFFPVYTRILLSRLRFPKDLSLSHILMEMVSIVLP